MRNISITLALAALTGCTVAPGANDQDPAADPSAVGGTGANLSVDFYGDTDVEGFHFEVTQVACDAFPDAEPDGSTLEFNVDLIDGVFPGMIELVETTLDPGSKHLGSDLFLTLDPGCYDVVAIPASAVDGEFWMPSEDCSTATAEDVEVHEEETTDVTLLSQCVGDPIGALDSLVLLNAPPSLEVTIGEKFNLECEPVDVCVTVSDPNDDPVEIDLEDLDDAFEVIAGDLVLIDFEDGSRVWQQCFEIVTDEPGAYEFTAAVHDLAPDAEGDLARIEDLIGEESHAELTFPIYTSRSEEPLCFDELGDLVPQAGVEIERFPGCDFATDEEIYCGPDSEVDEDLQDLLCEDDDDDDDDEDDLIEELLYPTCD